MILMAESTLFLVQFNGRFIDAPKKDTNMAAAYLLHYRTFLKIISAITRMWKASQKYNFYKTFQSFRLL
jgi:hypothetical protein